MWVRDFPVPRCLVIVISDSDTWELGKLKRFCITLDLTSVAKLLCIRAHRVNMITGGVLCGTFRFAIYHRSLFEWISYTTSDFELSSRFPIYTGIL